MKDHLILFHYEILGVQTPPFKGVVVQASNIRQKMSLVFSIAMKLLYQIFI